VLGEALFGTGRTSSFFYYVPVSTGIGGGYAHEKKLVHGANDMRGSSVLPISADFDYVKERLEPHTH